MKEAVIAGYVRSPFHFANKGDLTKVRPDDLNAAVVKALIARNWPPGIWTPSQDDGAKQKKKQQQ